MLKQDEKIIFSIKSGFSLNGLNDYNLDDKCLQLTNLGNIYISKVDCLAEENSEYIVYEYDVHKLTLNSEVDKESINVVSDYIPFTICKNGIEKSIELSIIIVFDFEEFAVIENQLENMIFDFKQGDTLMILDGSKICRGEFIGSKESIEFKSYNEDIKIRFIDVEDFTEEYNRIRFLGYFYEKSNLDIARKVSFIGDLSNYKLPLGFELLVESNKKIGFLPLNDRIVLTKIWGTMESRTYNSREVYIVKHSDMYVFIDRDSKKELVSRQIDCYSKYEIGEDKYIIFDGNNVFKIQIDKKSSMETGINRMPDINDKHIGYTDSGNPFFIKITDKLIKICASKDNCVLEIEKALVSDIKVNEENGIENGDLVNTEIKFGDKKLNINLKRNLITEIAENVFSDYQLSLFDSASIEEVYENWTKTIADMVVYNVFGEIYRNCSIFLKPHEFHDLEECIRFVNEYYEILESEKKKIDNVAVQLPVILEKNEINYFRGMGIDIDENSLKELRDVLSEIRYNMNHDIKEVLDKFNAISYVIMPDKNIEEFVYKLNKVDSYNIAYFVNKSYESIVHFVQDLLPFYIEKVIVTVFRAYLSLYKNYTEIEEKELKHELMNRIKSAHVFKQFTVENCSSILRKEIIDDLYSLVKFSSMRLYSELYYTGGYN